MPMQTLTLLQIAWTFAAYTLAVLGLPWLVLRRRLAAVPTAERWLGNFLAGNFYIINLVLVLQLLHSSNRVTLVLGTVCPLLLLYLRERRSGIKHELPQPRIDVVGWLRHNGAELVCVGLLAAAIFYEYGLDILRFYGYKASDVVVHNYWINLLDANQIFHAGVYPHGFHCMIYYLEQVFGIPTFVLLRVFSLVETFYIHLAVLVPLRALCKNRYLPYVGVIGYVLLPCLEYNTYWRYTATLPQEYGMLFIIPAGLFAIRFFQEVPYKRFALICFTISFSLTITVHFYDTVIAGLFCAGIALAYWKQFFRWPCFKRIIGAGLLSIALAVLPMAVGVLRGDPLQGSLYWGLKIIRSTAESEETVSEAKTTEAPAEPALPLREKLLPLYERIGSNAVGSGTRYRDAVTTGMITGGAVLLLLGALLHRREPGRAHVLCAVGWLDMLMLLLMEAPLLHLPMLMDGSRASIFFNYLQAFVWPLLLDGTLLLFPLQKFRKMLDGAVLLLLLAGCASLLHFHWVRPVCTSFQFDSNQEIACITNIMQENTRFDWTICSANEARQMILPEGRHEELITFLRKVGSGSTSVKIPTHYVYFFIEKQPIPYAGQTTRHTGKVVSEEGAAQPLSTAGGLTPYKEEKRWVTMCHIYAWARAFQKQHPDALQVYYEDDEFVCYRLTQNVKSLYELAIDYGQNAP